MLRTSEVACVLLLAEVEVDKTGEVVSCSPELGVMLTALRQAMQCNFFEGVIATHNASSDFSQYTVQVRPSNAIATVGGDDLVCPLTLEVPESLEFWGQAIYQTCRDVVGLRQWVQHQSGGAIGEGNLWLPIVLTAKGPLYGEVIGCGDSVRQSGAISGIDLTADTPSEINSRLQETQAQAYFQPVHFSDRLRQPLYRLGRLLLRSHSAPPAVYLLQFSFQDDNICFDRLFPFPAAPAIASIGVQIPNLFTCYWRCITRQPIQDLAISSIK